MTSADSRRKDQGIGIIAVGPLRLSGGDGHLCLVVFQVPHMARAYFAKMSVRKSTHLILLVNTQKDELPPLNGGLLSGGGWKMWQDTVVGTARGCVRPPGRV